MGVFSKLSTAWREMLEAQTRTPLDSFCSLVGVDQFNSQGELTADQCTFVAQDGSLMSILRVDGMGRMMGEEELNRIITEGNTLLSSNLSKPGHALQFYFMRDPDLAGPMLDKMLHLQRKVASNLEMDLSDVFDEKRRLLPRFLVHESFYIALWTRQSIFSKREAEQAKMTAKPPSLWPGAVDSQDLFGMARELRIRHEAFVANFQAGLRQLGLRLSQMGGHEAMAAMRGSIYPDRAEENWRPYLMGDEAIHPRTGKPSAPWPRKAEQGGTNPWDMSHLLWPGLTQQLFSGGGEAITQETARIGNRLFTGIDMTVGPQEVQTFDKLLQSMIALQEFPWRVSFLIEGAGLSSLGMRAFLASILGFTNSTNDQIKSTLATLKAHEAAGGVVARLRVSFATWGPSNKPELVEERASKLQRIVEGWGYCQASPSAGDPVAGAMSSALGIACASTAVPGCVPLEDCLTILPWMRDASPFKEGTVLFRTDDGRPWVYQQGSDQQDTFIDIISGTPGKGKSVWLNTTNLAFCLSPQSTAGAGGAKLPMVRIIDIGVSSSGLIDMLKEALPAKRRHEAEYIKIQMSKEWSINPLDTQPGCRYPLPLEKSFLVNFISLLATDAGQKRSPGGLGDMVSMVLDLAYEKFSDLMRDGRPTKTGSPKPYTQYADPGVDEAIQRYNLQVDEETSWWSLRDELFKLGAIREANLAQRHAVPRIDDLAAIANDAKVIGIYGNKTVEGETLIQMFNRVISSALRDYPILSDTTRFELGEARVVSLDLNDVAPQGSDIADKQTAVMYMLARNVLARDFYLNKDDLPHIPPMYRAYHEARITRIKETPKRLVMDEFHRTKNAENVRNQVIIDMREGRKWGVHLALASQLLDDFDEGMLEFATGIWIMNCSTETDKKKAASKFGLSRSAVRVLDQLNGPLDGGRGAPFLVILKLKSGTHEHKLINTLGPVELWAFSTTPADVGLRTRLYERLGPQEARKRLAKRFPNGSAKSEIARRTTIMMERGQVGPEYNAGIPAILADELCAEARE